MTKLTYFVGPDMVYCTRAHSESLVNLIISASNPTDDDIAIKEFTVIVPAGEGVNDLTNNSMNAVSMQDREWEFKEYRQNYRAMPVVPSTVLASGKSITFELRDVKINLSPGTAVIEIAEKDGDGESESVYFPINKIKSQLDVDSFSADVLEVSSGDPVTLTWKTTAAAGVTLFPREQDAVLPVNGSEQVHPMLTTTYTLTANGADPMISRQVTIMVLPPKINSFEPNHPEVNAGETVTLNWNVSNAHRISISPGYEHEILEAVGSKVVTPQTTTTYILTARNKALQTADQHEVVKIRPVTISKFTVTPNSMISPGDTVQLSWEMESATSAYILPIGHNIEREQLRAGTASRIVTKDTEFTLVAQNTINTKVKTVKADLLLKDWQVVTSDAPLGFVNMKFMPITLNYDNKIWVIQQKQHSVLNSANGRDWAILNQGVGSLPWAMRDELMGCVFNGKMWVLGGSDGGNPNIKYFKDVWSSTDGIHWTKEKDSADWSNRRVSSCFALNDKMFICGGIGEDNKALNDVWSTTNGSNWTKETDHAFSVPLFEHKTVIINNKAWVLSHNESSIYVSNNGVNWEKQASPAWMERGHKPFNCCATNDEIYASFITDLDNESLLMYKMNREGIWQKLPIPFGMQNAWTAWIGFKNMPWSLCGRLNRTPNRNVVVIAP
jgi:plastocyanin